MATVEQKAAANPKASVWVAANAGSGKTHVLIDRVVRLLLAGAPPQSILCLTFTKAAAAEMSTRLFARLASWVALGDDALRAELQTIGVGQATDGKLAFARRLFALAIETPGGLKIQTIHAFCEKLLQLFPVEAGLAPGFRVMEDVQKKQMLREAYQAVLNQTIDSDGDIDLSLLEAGAISGSEAFEVLADQMISSTTGFRLMLASKADASAIEKLLKASLGVAASDSIASVESELNIIDRVAYAEAAAQLRGRKLLRNHDVPGILERISKTPVGAPVISELSSLFLTKDGTERAQLLISATRLEFPAVANWLDGERARVLPLLIDHAHLTKIDGTMKLYRLMQQILGEFETLKQRRGLYDFDDLIARAAVLLNTSRAAQWVLYKLDSGLSHILIDEAQDTSPAQWRIISALADEFFAGEGRATEEYRTIFAVGDRKQSIYSFQGADTAAFAAARAHFKAKVESIQQSFCEIDLSVSYRSTPEILLAVDTVFAPGTTARAGFGIGADDERSHTAHRKTDHGRFEIWPLISPTGEEEPDHWDVPVDHEPSQSPRRRLARRIAETIKGWIGRRMLVAAERTVVASDILILLQSRNALFQALISELRRADVPVAGADRLKLHESLAIKDLVALAQFIVLPEDDLSLACVLKSPLLAKPLAEDELFAAAHGRRAQSLWSRIQELEQFKDQAAELYGLIELGRSCGPHAFFAAVITASRKRMVQRLGVEAGDATDIFLDLALGYEREGNVSLSRFISWFLARDSDVKRELEQASGEVRIMTVHGSKGLEANIVILPDAADMPGQSRGSSLVQIADGNTGAGLPFLNVKTLVKSKTVENWKSLNKIKSKEERKRLLYVAMTRARDELYVVGSFNKTQPADDCWYNLISDAFERPEAKSVLRHVGGDDPKADILRLGDDPAFASAAPSVPVAPMILPSWAGEIPVVAELPHGQPRGASTLARGEDGTINRKAALRGLAIHRLLDRLPGTPANQRENQALRMAHSSGLDEATALSLARLIDQPDLAGFFAENNQSEAAILGRIPGLGLVQGRVDRFAVTATSVWLLDYKSDARPSSQLADERGYVRQMALYAEVLRRAYPSRDIRAALLWTQTAALEWLDNERLSRSLDEIPALDGAQTA